MNRWKVMCLVVCLSCASRATACDLCAVYAAREAQGGSSKGWYAGLAEQFTYFNTLQANGHRVANDGEYIDSLISQVFAGYNFNSRVGLQLNLPFIYRAYGSATGGDHAEGGLGDVSILGNVLLAEKDEQQYTARWSAVGGLKFPTGSARRLNPALPDFATGIGGHDLTLGSGSYDGVVGTGVFLRWRRLFLTADTQYAIRSEGSFGYQFANDLTWNGGPGVYLILMDQHTLALQVIVSGETKGEDTVNGMPMDDSAITSVFLGPQLNFTWSDKLSVQAGGDLPVSIHSSGDQLVPDFRVRLAVTGRF